MINTDSCNRRHQWLVVVVILALIFVVSGRLCLAEETIEADFRFPEASCLKLCRFWGIPVDSTNEFKRVRVGVGNLGFNIATDMSIAVVDIELRDYQFTVDRRGEVRMFHDHGRKNLQSPIRTMEQICDYLAPQAHFAKFEYRICNNEKHYVWFREEGGVRVEDESIAMDIDTQTGACVGFVNRSLPRKLSLKVPDDFKVEEWRAKVLVYVTKNWKQRARNVVENSNDFYPKLVASKRSPYFYRRDKRLVCRFVFSVEPRIEPRPPKGKAAIGIDIDVDVINKVIIEE